MVRAGVVMLLEQCAKATPSRVPAALQRSTAHLPKQSSSGFLGKILPPFREQVHSNCPLLSIATFAIFRRYHARQVFA